MIEALRTEIGKKRRIKGTVLDAAGEGKMTPQDAARLIKAI